MKNKINIGKITRPITIDMPEFVPVIGAKSFGNIFSGALKLEIGDGSKISGNKISACIEDGHAAFR